MSCCLQVCYDWISVPILVVDRTVPEKQSIRNLVLVSWQSTHTHGTTWLLTMVWMVKSCKKSTEAIEARRFHHKTCVPQTLALQGFALWRTWKQRTIVLSTGNSWVARALLCLELQKYCLQLDALNVLWYAQLITSQFLVTLHQLVLRALDAVTHTCHLHKRF